MYMWPVTITTFTGRCAVLDAANNTIVIFTLFYAKKKTKKQKKNSGGLFTKTAMKHIGNIDASKIDRGHEHTLVR